MLASPAHIMVHLFRGTGLRCDQNDLQCLRDAERCPWCSEGNRIKALGHTCHKNPTVCVCACVCIWRMSRRTHTVCVTVAAPGEGLKGGRKWIYLHSYILLGCFMYSSILFIAFLFILFCFVYHKHYSLQCTIFGAHTCLLLAGTQVQKGVAGARGGDIPCVPGEERNGWGEGRRGRAASR